MKAHPVTWDRTPPPNLAGVISLVFEHAAILMTQRAVVHTLASIREHCQTKDRRNGQMSLVWVWRVYRRNVGPRTVAKSENQAVSSVWYGQV